MIEKWQTGPVPGFDPMLMPVVHSLLQVKAEIDDLLTRVTEEHVWARPGGAASIGFHLLHIGGSSARLLTYARGERLSPEQLADARSEATLTLPKEALAARVHAALDAAIEQVRHTPVSTLLEPRAVGRAGLPSTVIGLLFHVAEHATRHAGQALTTALVQGVGR